MGCSNHRKDPHCSHLFIFLLEPVNSSEKWGHPQILLRICTQTAPKAPWREPGHEGCCRVCLGARKGVHFPGAEKYSQPFVTTLEGAQTPGLSTQSPRHRCLNTTRQLLRFQLRSFTQPSVAPGLSAEQNLTCSISYELGSSHVKGKIHVSYRYC